MEVKKSETTLSAGRFPVSTGFADFLCPAFFLCLAFLLRSLIEINLPTSTRTVCQTFISSEDVIRSSSRLEIHDDGVRELPSRQPLSLHQSGKSAYQALL